MQSLTRCPRVSCPRAWSGDIPSTTSAAKGVIRPRPSVYSGRRSNGRMASTPVPRPAQLSFMVSKPPRPSRRIECRSCKAASEELASVRIPVPRQNMISRFADSRALHRGHLNLRPLQTILQGTLGGSTKSPSRWASAAQSAFRAGLMRATGVQPVRHVSAVQHITALLMFKLPASSFNPARYD